MRTPQQRDRMMQVYLAQARGTVRNGDLLRAAMGRMVRMRQAGGNTGVQMMDDPLIETLAATVEALESASVVYAVTGSIASSIHGEPFMSQDVDLILQATQSQAQRVAHRLGPRFYAPEDSLVEAALTHSFIHVVDNRTSLKADLSFVAPTGFLAETLERRVRATIGTAPHEFWFVTPEDVILMKLQWRNDTQSAKQWDNAHSVARVRGARMDWKYLFDQAERLGIRADLEKLRDDAGI